MNSISNIHTYYKIGEIKMNKDFKTLISTLIEAENTYEQTKIFEKNFNQSDNIRIFLFDEKRSNVPKSFKNREINGYKIFGLADYTKLWVLDSKHIGKSSRELRISKVVHFDLNILTYLNKYINNYKQSINTLDFIEYLQFIKNNHFSYNIFTAIMERSTSPINNSSKKIWSEIIMSYVKFSKVKFDNLKSNELLLTEFDYGGAKKIYDSLLEENQQLIQYRALSCLFLKAFLIKNDKKIKNKLDVLLQYSLDVLNVYLELETVLIYYYFNSDNSTKKTFEKIEGYSKKTVKNILNTTWDIFHIRLIEMSLLFDNQYKDDIFLSYFSSRDGAYNELDKINPIRMFLIYGGQSFTRREKGIVDVCSNEEILKKVEEEAEKRKRNVNKVNLENEQRKLINQIEDKQNLIFENKK